MELVINELFFIYDFVNGVIMINESKAKRQIVEVGRWLYDKELIVATDGNLSIRLGNRIIATPSGMSKGFLKESDLVIVDINGNKLAGRNKPSTELKMHTYVYKVRPDVLSVVHAHPPKATAFTIAGVSMAKCVMPEVVVSLGAIPTAPYATPSTDEVVNSICEYIKQSDAVMLDRHGSLTVGDTIYSAYNKLEKIEHTAQIMIYAKMLGGVQTLSPSQVDKLMELRKTTYGLEGDVVRCDDSCGLHDNCNRADNNDIVSDNTSHDDLVRIITNKVMEHFRDKV